MDRGVRCVCFSAHVRLFREAGKSASGFFRVIPCSLLVGVVVDFVRDKVGVQLAARAFGWVVPRRPARIAVVALFGALFAPVPKVAPQPRAVEGHLGAKSCLPAPRALRPVPSSMPCIAFVAIGCSKAPGRSVPPHPGRDRTVSRPAFAALLSPSRRGLSASRSIVLLLPASGPRGRKRANARCHRVPGIGAATAESIFQGNTPRADPRPWNRAGA